MRHKCPNTELFLVCIQSKCRKIRTRNNSVFGHFWHIKHNIRSGYCAMQSAKRFSRSECHLNIAHKSYSKFIFIKHHNANNCFILQVDMNYPEKVAWTWLCNIFYSFMAKAAVTANRKSWKKKQRAFLCIFQLVDYFFWKLSSKIYTQ